MSNNATWAFRTKEIYHLIKLVSSFERILSAQRVPLIRRPSRFRIFGKLIPQRLVRVRPGKERLVHTACSQRNPCHGLNVLMCCFNSIILQLHPTELQTCPSSTRREIHRRIWWMLYNCIFGNPVSVYNVWRHGLACHNQPAREDAALRGSCANERTCPLEGFVHKL